MFQKYRISSDFAIRSKRNWEDAFLSLEAKMSRVHFCDQLTMTPKIENTVLKSCVLLNLYWRSLVLHEKYAYTGQQKHVFIFLNKQFLRRIFQHWYFFVIIHLFSWVQLNKLRNPSWSLNSSYFNHLLVHPPCDILLW